ADRIMPSSSSFTTRQSLPHLSQIIHLEPDKEPWCAGYAPSQGRRCHASTNAHGRRRAMSLLDEATEALHAGRCIDDLLDELAPHVLCRRWHQSQASDLTSRWKKQIRSYMRSHSSSRRESTSLSARQPTLLSTRTSNREPTRAIGSELSLTNVEEQCAELYQTLQSTLAELRRLQALQASVPISSSTIETSTPRALDVTKGNGHNTYRKPSGANRSEGSDTSPAGFHAAALVSDNPQTEERATSRDRHSSLCPAIQVTRRDIEGPCGICLEALKGTELDDSDDSDEEYDSDSDGDEDYNEVNEGESEQEEPRLVYCRAQCGNNFHETCLHEWLEHSTRPTCPMCRCAWRN
ncbi:hypothetical protein N7494_002934, partial [Penicillium frequentans]